MLVGGIGLIHEHIACFQRCTLNHMKQEKNLIKNHITTPIIKERREYVMFLHTYSLNTIHEKAKMSSKHLL